MNEDDYFDYLVETGAMRPEEDKLKRKQAMVEELRKSAMTTPQGEMVGRTYVAPAWTQYAAQLFNAYGSRKGQQAVDKQAGDMNAVRKAMLEALRAKRAATPTVAAMPGQDDEDMIGPVY
jgi:hypothetical protein